MTFEVYHEVTEERRFPLIRLTSAIVALAKNAESHSSDATVPTGKGSDKLRSSLTRSVKAFVEAFGRSADPSLDFCPLPIYYSLTRYPETRRAVFQE
jgi:hypothetical protein